MTKDNEWLDSNNRSLASKWRNIIKEEVLRTELGDRLYRLYRDRSCANIPFQRFPLDLQFFAAGEQMTDLVGKATALTRRMRDGWERLARDLRLAGTATLGVPVGIWALGSGFSLPDADIELLGIGRHRFFAFHSGLLIWATDQLYRRYVCIYGCNDPGYSRSGIAARGSSRTSGLVHKIAGIGLGAAALGVGQRLRAIICQLL